MKYVLFVILLAFSTPSFAYNWNRCKTSSVYKPTAPNTGSTDNPFKITGKTMANATIDKTSGGMASTTSYVSSTGPCKAFGMAEEQRIQYIAATHIELQVELAEGHGDHISSLSVLYGCNSAARSEFSQIMRSNHSTIFPRSAQDNPVELTKRITDTLVGSELLRNNCNPEKV